MITVIPCNLCRNQAQEMLTLTLASSALLINTNTLPSSVPSAVLQHVQAQSHPTAASPLFSSSLFVGDFSLSDFLDEPPSVLR